MSEGHCGTGVVFSVMKGPAVPLTVAFDRLSSEPQKGGDVNTVLARSEGMKGATVENLSFVAHHQAQTPKLILNHMRGCSLHRWLCCFGCVLCDCVVATATTSGAVSLSGSVSVCVMICLIGGVLGCP